MNLLFGIGEKLAWLRGLVDPLTPYNDIIDVDDPWERPTRPPDKVISTQGVRGVRNRVRKRPKSKPLS